MSGRNDERPSRASDDMIDHDPIVVGRHVAHVTYDRAPERSGIADVVGTARASCTCGWATATMVPTTDDARAAIDQHLDEARQIIRLEREVEVLRARLDDLF